MPLGVQHARADMPLQDLADLLWGTDPKLNAYMFRSLATLQKILAAEWPRNQGMLCHRQAFTVSTGDVLRGLMVGHSSQEWPGHFEASLVVQTQYLSQDEASYLKDAIYWMDRLFPTPRDNSFYILELAVKEAAQGGGVAKQLLEAGLDRAREKGCSSICLDVAASNAAVSFYEHLSFEVEIETRVPFLATTHGIDLHYHMARSLEPLA